tara:strand:+ start:106 stop:747 length:642 start_codon:yes stop_codon:yes gene_type:complete
MMPLVQWLLIGLALAIVSLPLVRWFWKRWDKPTPEMVALKEEKREQNAEARVWAAMEAKIDAETIKKHEWAEVQMAKAVALVKAKPLNEVSASKAWDALGVDEPIIISTTPEIDISDLLEDEEEVTVIDNKSSIESEIKTVESEEKETVPSMVDLPSTSPELLLQVDDELPQDENIPEISDIDDIEKDVIEHFAAPVRQHDPDEEDDWHEVLW